LAKCYLRFSVFYLFSVYSTIVYLTNSFDPQDWFPFPPVQFGPVVEPDHETAFLTESPTEAYKNGHVAKKPWISTTTSREGQTGRLGMAHLCQYE